MRRRLQPLQGSSRGTPNGAKSSTSRVTSGSFLASAVAAKNASIAESEGGEGTPASSLSILPRVPEAQEGDRLVSDLVAVLLGRDENAPNLARGEFVRLLAEPRVIGEAGRCGRQGLHRARCCLSVYGCEKLIEPRQVGQGLAGRFSPPTQRNSVSRPRPTKMPPTVPAIAHAVVKDRARRNDSFRSAGLCCSIWSDCSDRADRLP
jgi:hypothetical protein